ncbi:MAG: hypothetical protein C0614_02475 [Desulfuromonas sp.]|nr:MAG: hypothetical protein C0614_02475 [Desulfuromonas sp.]
MGRNVLLLILLVGLVGGCASSMSVSSRVEREPTVYAGVYGEDLVWSGQVTMDGDVLILENARLTILPGTEVLVTPAEGTQIDPEYLSSLTELLVRGRLDIQGSAAEPVRFVAANSVFGEDYAWAGIILDQAGESRIVHAEIVRAETAIRTVSCSPLIEGNLISHCRYGIVTQQQSHPKVLDNTIRNGEGGLFCWGGSNPYLKGNRIIDHDEEGVFVDAGSRPWLDRNTISGNSIGLAIYPRDLPFDPFAISNNRQDVRFLGSQGLAGEDP